MAQDTPPSRLWTGLYVGLELGVGSGQMDFKFPQTGRDWSPKIEGGLVGGQVGYNWRSGAWVYGAEATLLSTSLHGSGDCPNPSFKCLEQLGSLGHVNGRLGYALGHSLFSLTGGLSVGHVRHDAEYVGPNYYPSGLRYTGAETHTGWNAGLGYDYALGAGWSAGVQYRHVQLGGADHAMTSSVSGRSSTSTLSANADYLSARVVYSFGSAH